MIVVWIGIATGTFTRGFRENGIGVDGWCWCGIRIRIPELRVGMAGGLCVLTTPVGVVDLHVAGKFI